MNKKIGILILLIFAGALVWTIHGAIHFSGPYAMVAHAELKLSNGYAPVGTFLIAFGLVAIAALLPLVPIRLIFFPVKDKDASVANVLAKADKLQFHLHANYYKIAAAGIAVGSFAIGAYWLFQGLTAGPLTTVAVEDLYRETYDPPSRYVSVASGELSWEDRISVREQRQGTFVYVPLRVSDAPEDGQSRVIVRIDEREAMKISRLIPPFTGVLSRPLDGFVRDLFEHEGFPIAHDAWEMDVEESPGKLKGMGILMILVGSGVAGFLAWRGRAKKSAARLIP